MKIALLQGHLSEQISAEFEAVRKHEDEFVRLVIAQMTASRPLHYGPFLQVKVSPGVTLVEAIARYLLELHKNPNEEKLKSRKWLVKKDEFTKYKHDMTLEEIRTQYSHISFSLEMDISTYESNDADFYKIVVTPVLE